MGTRKRIKIGTLVASTNKDVYKQIQQAVQKVYYSECIFGNKIEKIVSITKQTSF